MEHFTAEQDQIFQEIVARYSISAEDVARISEIVSDACHASYVAGANAEAYSNAVSGS